MRHNQPNATRCWWEGRFGIVQVGRPRVIGKMVLTKLG